MYFVKFRILQLLLKIWFSALKRGLSNFWAADILNRINIAIHGPYILQLRRAYLKNCILWNFAFYSFCWRLGFQLFDKGLVNLGLLNILNEFNIANPCPMYTGTRKKISIFNLKNCIFRNFIFYSFSKYI